MFLFDNCHPPGAWASYLGAPLLDRYPIVTRSLLASLRERAKSPRVTPSLIFEPPEASQSDFWSLSAPTLGPRGLQIHFGTNFGQKFDVIIIIKIR